LLLLDVQDVVAGGQLHEDGVAAAVADNREVKDGRL